MLQIFRFCEKHRALVRNFKKFHQLPHNDAFCTFCMKPAVVYMACDEKGFLFKREKK